MVDVEDLVVGHDVQVAPGHCDRREREGIFWGLVSMYRIMQVHAGGDGGYTERVSQVVTKTYSNPPFNRRSVNMWPMQKLIILCAIPLSMQELLQL